MRIELQQLGGRTLEGFRYFWMKRVTGFDPAHHCARCLVGDYCKEVSNRLPVGHAIDVASREGELFYLCGVATPYRWENNAHLALHATPGGIATLRLYTGALLVVHGAEAVPFGEHAARRLYPGRGAAFLTCRNFQFGAQLFAGQQ